MNPIITSADQLNWITPDKLPADDCRGIDVEGAYALAVIDDDNLLAIYVDVIADEARLNEWECDDDTFEAALIAASCMGVSTIVIAADAGIDIAEAAEILGDLA